MKKLLTLALLLVAASAFTQNAYIGLYADTGATTRFAGIAPYTPLDTYLIAIVPDTGPISGGITAAEFKMENWPSNPGYPVGNITITATSDLVLGGLDTDYSIAWAEPQGAGGGLVLIATVNFLMFDAGWIPQGHVTTPVAGDDCACLVVVDNLYEIHNAIGLPFYFSATAADESSWSQVKSLY